MLAAARKGVPPRISLSDDYKLVDNLDRLDTPSLIECRSLTIRGAIRLEPGVVVRGDVVFENSGKSVPTVTPRVYTDETVHASVEES